MTSRHAHSEPQFADYRRSVLDDANGQLHSADIAVGCSYVSGLTQLADLLAARPGRVHILIDHPPQTDDRTVLWYNRNCLRPKGP